MSGGSNYIYFASPVEGGPIKIGCSQLPKQRLKQLVFNSPYPLEILVTAPGTIDDERKIHGHFLACHLRSEWFKPSVELWALIGLVKATGEIPSAMRGKKPEPDPLRALINRKTGRASPEWRAACGERSKAWWARKKQDESLVIEAMAFMRDRGMNREQFNEMVGQRVLGARSQNDLYVSHGQTNELEAFLVKHRKAAA